MHALPVLQCMFVPSGPGQDMTRPSFVQWVDSELAHVDTTLRYTTSTVLKKEPKRSKKIQKALIRHHQAMLLTGCSNSPTSLGPKCASSCHPSRWHKSSPRNPAQIRARDPLTISEFPGGTPKSSILKRLSWDIPIYGNPHIWGIHLINIAGIAVSLPAEINSQ